MVGEGDQAWLVLGGELVAWSLCGYGNRRRLHRGTTLHELTPPSMIEVVRAGYEPALHPTSGG